MPEGVASRVPVMSQLRQMGPNFWVANLIEAGERLAFFGVRAVLPLYMVGTTVGLSFSEKGFIYMVWALLQCLVPMVSGGYTDTYGYKKSLVIAFCINIVGYVIMANAHGFWSMLAAGVCVGCGTAVFKPAAQGAIARSLNETNSGLGFGVFYWVVNIGGFLAPMAAAWARGTNENPTWPFVFYGAAAVTALNLLPSLFLFREPERPARKERPRPLQVFKETLLVLWKDQAMLRFLLIVSGFWFMFMQLWDLLPNFIDEWVDTRDIGAWLTSLFGAGAARFLDSAGGAKPEILINIDSFVIVLFVLPLSWLFSRFRMMTALTMGMAIALVGFIGAGMTTVGTLCALMIVVFAFGEIICSPKFSEYIGMTAPPDKKALYMGYSNIPFAIGWAAGNGVSGWLYDNFASRTAFARRFLLEQWSLSPTEVQQIPPEELLPTLAAKMGAGATIHDARQALWEAYHPWVIWLFLGAIGFLSLAGMILSYRRTAARTERKPRPAADASSQPEPAFPS